MLLLYQAHGVWTRHGTRHIYHRRIYCKPQLEHATRLLKDCAIMWEPFGSAPAHGTAFWRGSPNERGTLNILSICIITLLLCAYTSLHLDIPKYGKAGWIHQFWRRLLWVCVGLAAPEFVSNPASFTAQKNFPKTEKELP
jgi:hypothetical protein